MTNKRNRLLVGIVLINIFILIRSLNAQNDGILEGTLSDPQGAVLANSVIELRWNDSLGPKHRRPRKKHLITNTDISGLFMVKLVPGAWDVFAYRDGFAPVCTLVYIEESKMTKIELRFPKYGLLNTD